MLLDSCKLNIWVSNLCCVYVATAATTWRIYLIGFLKVIMRNIEREIWWIHNTLKLEFRYEGVWISISVGSPGATVTNQKTGWLYKKQKFIFSQFWRLKFWQDDSACVVFPLKPVEENSSLPFPDFGVCQQFLEFFGL